MVKVIESFLGLASGVMESLSLFQFMWSWMRQLFVKHVAYIPSKCKYFLHEQKLGQIRRDDYGDQADEHGKRLKGKQLHIDTICKDASWVMEQWGNFKGVFSSQESENKSQDKSSHRSIRVGAGEEQGAAQLREQKGVHQLSTQEPKVIHGI